MWRAWQVPCRGSSASCAELPPREGLAQRSFRHLHRHQNVDSPRRSVRPERRTGEGMSDVELRNRDLLQQGLDLVARPLHAAMEAEFARNRGAMWLERLAEESSWRSRVSSDDLASLIGLAFANWGPLAKRLGRDHQAVRNRLGLLRDERHKNAHGNASADRSPDDVLGVLKLVKDTLVALDTSPDAVVPLQQECVRRLAGPVAKTAPARTPDAVAPERFDALTQQVVQIGEQLEGRRREDARRAQLEATRQDEQRPVTEPQMKSVLSELSTLQRTIESLTSTVFTPQPNDEVAEIREQLQRLERSLEDRNARFDPQHTADELLAATRQMLDLEQREQHRPSLDPDRVREASAEPTPPRSPITSERPSKRAPVRKTTAKPARHRKRWTRADDEALLAGWQTGRTVSELARSLKRTPTAVAGRLRTDHDVNWMFLAPELPQRGEIVGWQGLPSWVDTARRRQVGLQAIVGADDGRVIACRVTSQGQITIGPARRDGETDFEFEREIPCSTAVDTSRQLDTLLGSATTPEMARILSLTIEEVPPSRPSRSASYPASPARRAAGRSRTSAKATGAGSQTRKITTGNLADFGEEIGYDFEGWTALEVATQVAAGHYPLPPGWEIGPATLKAIEEGGFPEKD